MKKITRFLSGLSLAVFSIGAAIGVSLASNKDNVEKAEANTVVSSYVYRFTDNYNFSGQDSGNRTMYAYAYNSDSDKNANWPGVEIGFSYNSGDQKVFVYTSSKSYSNIIFHNNYKARAEVTTGGATSKAWYVTGWKSEWDGSEQKTNTSTWTPVNNTFYLYDDKGTFSKGAKCYAWMSGGAYHNAAYPGVAMTAVQYGSGHYYSVSVDPMFDRVQFGLNGDSNTGDIWANHSNNQCFIFWGPFDSGNDWNASLDYACALDWLFHTMHLRDIPTSNNEYTGACYGAGGYYEKAYEAYSHFGDGVKAELAKHSDWNNAKARFIAWAKANGHTASFSGTTLTVNAPFVSLPVSTDGSSETTMLVILTTIVAIGGIAGFFFLKKKHI